MAARKNSLKRLAFAHDREDLTARKSSIQAQSEASSALQTLGPAMSPSTDMLSLQRAIGNAAVQQLVRAHQTDSARHGHSCGCAACSTVSRALAPDNMLQRQGESKSKTKSGDTTVTSPPPATKDDLIRAFKAETLAQPASMATLASKLTIAEFITLADNTAIGLKPALKALFTYWAPVPLATVEPVVKAASPDERKTCWNDSAFMSLAESKLGADPYLTFVTYLGMNKAPTTDELSEGGKEHTPAREADRLIRSTLDKYVTTAVAEGRQIEGKVGVVGSADWDRAGIAHYGQAVWRTGPPPKTPKKDAINGFVDSKGRVWIERNSGNPGTLIHEGIHKYSEGSYLSTLGFNANEGTTEYFTRIICKDLDITRGNYETQYKIIDTLVNNVASKEIVASAYFDGDIGALKEAFMKYRKRQKFVIARLFTGEKTYERDWNSFISHMQAGDYAKARKLIE